MRGTRGPRRAGWAIRLREERGVSAVIVAVSLVAIFGAGVLAIDTGSLYTTRRNLITATDAAALAAARHFSQRFASGCDAGTWASAEAEAVQVLLGNHPNALHNAIDTPNGFEVTPNPTDCTMGHVRFDARLEANTAFAGIFNLGRTKVLATSTAQWGPLSSVIGARPIGICVANGHFVEWNVLYNAGFTPASRAVYDALFGVDDPVTPEIDHPASTPIQQGGADSPTNGEAYLGPGNGGGVVHRVTFNRTALDGQCGESPGNWGWLDFNDNAPPNGGNALKDWIPDPGYPGAVSLTPHDCNPENQTTNDDCPAKTGAGGTSLQDALTSVWCQPSTPTASCTKLPIIVYDSMADQGSNTTFHQVAFLGVVLRAWASITGSANNEGFFDFEFIDAQFTGVVNPNASPGLVTLQGVNLCGADHDVSAPGGSGADLHRCAV